MVCQRAERPRFSNGSSEGTPPRASLFWARGDWGKDYRVGLMPFYGLHFSIPLDSLGYLYHTLSHNADIQVHFDERNPDHCNLFNVCYVVAPIERTPLTFLSRIEQFGRHILYQAPTCGYFDLVDSDVALVVSKDNWYKATLEWFQSPLSELKQHPSIFFDEMRGSYPVSLLLEGADANTISTVVPLEHRGPVGRITAEEALGDTYLASVVADRAGYRC
jgi:hypothetical protein